MKRIGLLPLSLAVAMVMFSSAPAWAIPMLQLDVSGGLYIGGSQQTIFSTGSTFTLYALKLGAFPATNYYVSAAVVPQTVPPGVDAGSFEFGTLGTIQVTGDMIYGVPPLESTLAATLTDPGDLATHGIFQTYFKEMTLSPDAALWQRVSAYDSQSSPGGPTLDPNGTMWAFAIPIDVSGLAPGYSIHFDLYSDDIITSTGDIDVDKFAPFGYDAQSGSGPEPVPEPASLALLGSGCVLLAAKLRRRK